MKLEKQMLVALTDRKEYVVLTTLDFNDKSYVYLVEKENPANVKFCVQELENNKIKLIEVNDMSLRRTLLAKFTEKLKEELDNN